MDVSIIKPKKGIAIMKLFGRVIIFLSSVFFSNLGTASSLLGTKAPDFEMQGTDGETYSMDSLAGKHFVISFFPKAFTGG